MSRLDALLRQTEPLETHEKADLKDWLAVLEVDCELFGETPEDTRRMNSIKARLGRA